MRMWNLQFKQERFNHGIKRGGLDVTNLLEAAQSGDKRKTLIALAELESLPDPEEKRVSRHDKLKQKHENR